MTGKQKHPASPEWVVLKYGGTSVAAAGNWPMIAGVLRERQANGLRPVLVHSALAGVSDRLESLARQPAADDRDALVEQVADFHNRLVEELGLDPPQELVRLVEEMRRLAAGIALTGEASPPLEARLMALGELMASTIIVAYLRGQGFDVLAADAREVLRSRRVHSAHDPRRFLAAVCDSDRDTGL
ncbi:MAG: bifunctional aspartate kinase/diaminopimelate decarboxylase, partial [Gammaproteobacteria bacterium]